MTALLGFSISLDKRACSSESIVSNKSEKLRWYCCSSCIIFSCYSMRMNELFVSSIYLTYLRTQEILTISMWMRSSIIYRKTSLLITMILGYYLYLFYLGWMHGRTSFHLLIIQTLGLLPTFLCVSMTLVSPAASSSAQKLNLHINWTNI